MIIMECFVYRDSRAASDDHLVAALVNYTHTNLLD